MVRKQTVRTAIVTGASSGIGRELVRQLAHHPKLPEITIIATARRSDRLQSLQAECPRGKVIVHEADLASPEQRKTLTDRAREEFETLDLLVNNAGLGAYAPFERTDPKTVRQIFAVDVEAVFELTAEAIRWMKPHRRGQIVQVSSVLGEVAIPYSSVYVAAKHAVNGLVKSVRYELEGSGVSVWAACPGQTVSEFRSVAGADPTRSTGVTAESTEKVVAGIVRGIVRGHSRAVLYPTWRPWFFAECERRIPWMWDRIMIRSRSTLAAEDLPGQLEESR